MTSTARPRIAKAFDPELVLVSAGFDMAPGDPLGGCRVSPNGFFKITKQLMGLAQGKLVLVQEGGYNVESNSILIFKETSWNLYGIYIQKK